MLTGILFVLVLVRNDSIEVVFSVGPDTNAGTLITYNLLEERRT
jgi:hypothetical protein